MTKEDSHIDERRRSMMSRVRTRNTEPEMFLRRLLHQRGFRFTLHKRIAGVVVDICLPKWHVVIFVHGCFWHRHLCKRFSWPKSRELFWKEKLNKNHIRDQKAISDLNAQGWRVAVVWECWARGRKTDLMHHDISKLENWIKESRSLKIEIPQG